MPGSVASGTHCIRRVISLLLNYALMAPRGTAVHFTCFCFLTNFVAPQKLEVLRKPARCNLLLIFFVRNVIHKYVFECDCKQTVLSVKERPHAWLVGFCFKSTANPCLSPCENDLDPWLKNRDSEHRSEGDRSWRLSFLGLMVSSIFCIGMFYFSRNQGVRKYPHDITLLSHSLLFFL
jgi:hypothetical protein